MNDSLGNHDIEIFVENFIYAIDTVLFAESDIQ